MESAGETERYLQFSILGSLVVRARGEDATPSAPKLRAVLALLVLRNNQLVGTEDLICELWGGRPPRSARTTLQTYVHKLRKSLFPDGAARAGWELHTRQQGYCLEIPPDSVDQYQFEQTVHRGGAALDGGEPQRAAELLRRALGLWRGSVLGGTEKGVLLAAHAAGLEERRLRALESRIEADFQLGRHRQLVSELKELVVAQPLNERFHGRLMLALHRCQRRDEALGVYRGFRQRTIDELGLEPSPFLQRVHQSLLAGEAEVERSPARRIVLTPPAQLPSDIADFVGRTELVEEAVAWLTPGERADGVPRLLTVNGMPGVGKSVFAVHTAHRLRSRFADGQLYACLHTTEGRARDPGDVLGSLLRAVGVAEDQLPREIDDRAALFRTWSAEKRVLVVLDDVGCEAQVRPLLPAGPQCAAVITARPALPGLAGARTVRLDPFGPDESAALLAAVIGPARVALERQWADRIGELCGHHPLAVRCAAARLSSVRGWPVREMAGQLDGERALDLLCFHDLDVRGRFASSYRALSPRAQTAFRALAVAGVPSATVAELASLLGCDATEAGVLLFRLVDHGLLRLHAAGAELRLEFHPLTRRYAEKLAADVAARPAGSGDMSVCRRVRCH